MNLYRTRAIYRPTAALISVCSFDMIPVQKTRRKENKNASENAGRKKNQSKKGSAKKSHQKITFELKNLSADEIGWH